MNTFFNDSYNYIFSNTYNDILIRILVRICLDILILVQTCLVFLVLVQILFFSGDFIR